MGFDGSPQNRYTAPGQGAKLPIQPPDRGHKGPLLFPEKATPIQCNYRKETSCGDSDPARASVIGMLGAFECRTNRQVGPTISPIPTGIRAYSPW